MQLPFDIVDYIFSFLVSDRKTLIACSKDPVLFPFVERHIYDHIVVQFGIKTTTDTDDALRLAFGPEHLVKLVSENPHIVYYVRILQIQIDSGHPDEMDDSFANTLLKFPGLECIMLAASKVRGWNVLDSFRAALEDRLNLPTVKEVHLRGDRIPLSLLNNSKNITNLSFSGFSIEDRLCASALPQLHSLRLLTRDVSPSLLTWIKCHIKELRSFQCALKDGQDVSGLLELCSGTLKKLDLSVEYLRFFDFPPVLFNLEQLTIRTMVEGPTGQYYSMPWFPSVVNIVNLFSSLRHLAIDFNTSLATDFNTSHLTLDESSSLAALGAASRSIPHVDLYFHTDTPQSPVPRAQILSSLDTNEDIARSIKMGVLVIHWEQAAPDCV